MTTLWLALLNVGRNRRRTALTLALMATGTAGLIINSGLISFIFNGLRDEAIFGRYGHLQIYRKGYSQEHGRAPFEYLIPEQDYSQLVHTLTSLPQIKAVTPELSVPVFLSAGNQTASGIARGIEPADIGILSVARLVSGTDRMSAVDGPADVLIGRGLGEKLQAHVGDFLSIMAINKHRAYNAQDTRVAGIFEEGFRDYDDWSIKLPLASLQTLLGEHSVEKVLVVLNDTRSTSQVRAQIESLIRDQQLPLEVSSWYELAVFYRQVIAMFGKELDLIKWIVQVIVLFGILACLSMAFTERQREMATLLSLGVSRLQLGMLFLGEGLCLGAMASLLGTIGAVLIGQVISIIGIPMPPPPGSTRPFVARIDFSFSAIAHYVALTFLMAIVGSLVPTLWAWRLNIANALRPDSG